jgi:hypothetical protein
MRLIVGLCMGLLVGLLVGVAAAVLQIRAGVSADRVQNGPWSTHLAQGSAAAPALTRARVALGGLLALPRSEAMYFVATTDSALKPLDGRCRYRIEGPALDADWWSITLYEGAGWLVPNDADRWSVPGHAPARDARGRWSFEVGPERPQTPAVNVSDAGNAEWDSGAPVWLPTGGVERFDLTLRAYQPGRALQGDPATVALPRIRRVDCLS